MRSPSPHWIWIRQLSCFINLIISHYNVQRGTPCSWHTLSIHSLFHIIGKKSQELCSSQWDRATPNMTTLRPRLPFMCQRMWLAYLTVLLLMKLATRSIYCEQLIGSRVISVCIYNIHVYLSGVPTPERLMTYDWLGTFLFQVYRVRNWVLCAPIKNRKVHIW